MYFEIIASWKEVEELVKVVAKKKLEELEYQISKLDTEKNKLKKLVNPYWELEEAMKKNNRDNQTTPVPYNPWHNPQPFTTPWTYPGTGTFPNGPTWTTTTCGTATSQSIGGTTSNASNHTHSITVNRPRTDNEIEGQR